MPVVGLAAVLLALAPLAVHAPMISSSTETSDTPIAIAFVDPHLRSLAADAQALADGVNAERAKHGLPALQRNATLDRIAYAKAVDMAARGYFGHTDPEGVTFQDRVRAWHLNVYAAENIAFDTTEPRAQTAFVNSPPHYSSEIDPREQNIGVAVVTVGRGQTFYVADFSGK
jgi:uncharacterized protein YkwD